MLKLTTGAIISVELSKGGRGYAQLASSDVTLKDGWVAIVLDLITHEGEFDKASLKHARILTAGRFFGWSALLARNSAELVGFADVASDYCVPWHRTLWEEKWVYTTWDGRHEFVEDQYFEAATHNKSSTAVSLAHVIDHYVGGEERVGFMTHPWQEIAQSCSLLEFYRRQLGPSV